MWATMDMPFPILLVKKNNNIDFEYCPVHGCPEGREKGKIMNKQHTNDFMKVLFNDDEYIWVGNQYRSWKISVAMPEALVALQSLNCSKDGVFVGLNPAKAGGLTMSKDNLSQYRNFLIEMDGIQCLETQFRLIHLTGIKYSSIVYSGNRSLHVVIALEEALPCVEMYKIFHEAICLKFANLADAATSNPAVSTKVAGKFRKSKLTGEINEQKLIELKTRVSWDSLVESIHEEIKQVHKKKTAKAASKRVLSSNSFYNDFEIFRTYLDDVKGLYNENQRISAQCPLCEREGHDKSKNNLSLDLRGEKVGAKCFANESHGFIEIVRLLKERYTPAKVDT
jgi:hypothetical protein